MIELDYGMDLTNPQFSMFSLIVGFVLGMIFVGLLQRRGNSAAKPPAAASVDFQRVAEKNLGRLSGKSRRTIEQLVADDRIIEAVRDVRQELGIGLKEAKDVVDLVGAQQSRGARP